MKHFCKKGFTLIELLVVVAIIAVLIAMLLPALGSARSAARAVVCSTRMGQLSKAVLMYEMEYRQVPYFHYVESVGGVNKDIYWITKLASYVGQPGELPLNSAEIQRCTEQKPDQGGVGWIGVNYSAGWKGRGNPIAPFMPAEYNGKNTSVRTDAIPNPSRYLFLTDTMWGMLYSPAYWYFQADQDSDGKLDSHLYSWDWMYNRGAPKIHRNGSNVSLADGHVEWVAFDVLWAPGRGSNGRTFTRHPYWWWENPLTLGTLN